MSLKRLWTRREALPPASDATTVRNMEELGNPVTLNMALAGCPARDIAGIGDRHLFIFAFPP